MGILCRFFVMFVASLSIFACASTHMQQYMGKDIREVVLDSGPPINMLDMGDGRRAFQFRWGGGEFVLPQTTTMTGNSTIIGNTAWHSGSAITSGGGVIASEGCVITYFARRDESRKAWIVTDFQMPKQMVC